MRNLAIKTVLVFLLSFTTQAGVVVLNGLTHTSSGNSGDIIEGEIVLLNTTDQEQRLIFKLSDALYSCGSTRIFSDSLTHTQSSKSWFLGSLMDKVLIPKEKYVYKYALKIPKDYTVSGTFWSVLMIEVQKPIKKERLTQQIDLDTKVRYAIGLITHVNQKSEVNLDFKNVQLQENEDHKNSLQVNLFNSSDYVEGVRLNLEVYNENGDQILKTKTKRLMVFPNMCIDYNLDISHLKTGSYQCLLTADARKEYVGTNISLNIK